MSPIAVTGVHRSGTSLVAHMLRSAGLYLGEDGDLLQAAPDNIEGFFEHAGFIRLDDELLGATGGAWDHPPTCGPMAVDDPRVQRLRDEAEALVAGLAVYQPWGWKDPRTCLTARFWIDLVPDTRFVVCVRHPLEVALSLKQRNQASYLHGLSLWHAYYAQVLEAVPEGRRIVTHYDAHFEAGVEEAERLLDFAGLPNDGTAQARAVVRPKLRHYRLSVDLEEAGVSRPTIDLYRRLCDEAGRPSGADAKAAGPVHVSPAAVDLIRANHDTESRTRQVASLERERAELRDRVAELEAAVDGSLLRRVHTRLDALEAVVHQARYKQEDLGGRPDDGVVRGCREIVRSHVGRDDRVVVVAKGDPSLLDLYGRPTGNFPQDEHGRYPGFSLADSAAAIAHLEALRLDGARYFLLPETSAWWLENFPAFTEHLVGSYRVVADQPGAGLLVDIRTRRDAGGGWSRSISEVLGTIGTACGCPPAVLDWTGLDLRSHVPGQNVFLPPPGKDRLPYLDATVDVVVVDTASRLDEARRVGGHAVVSVSTDEASCPVVVDVEILASDDLSATSPRLVVVVPSDDPQPAWSRHLRETLGEGVQVLLAPDHALLAAAAAEADLVALVDEGVLPLPGWLDAAGTVAGRSATGAVVAKVFARDGSLEAAGTVVFADGSTAGVAAGSFDVSAPWHEFVRGTHSGTGLTVFTPAALAKVGQDALASLDSSAWCAGVWAAGLRVVYQPEAAAVRALPPTSGDRPDRAHAWCSLVDVLPARPPALDDAAWARLVQADGPETGPR